MPNPAMGPMDLSISPPNRAPVMPTLRPLSPLEAQAGRENIGLRGGRNLSLPLSCACSGGGKDMEGGDHGVATLEGAVSNTV